MTKLIIDEDAHNNYLNECVESKPDLVFISTFGAYAGISETGQDTTKWKNSKYKAKVRPFIDKLNELKQEGASVKILVGLSNFSPCTKIGCVDCEDKHLRGLIRLCSHADAFSNIDWRFTTNFHLKSYLFFYEDGSVKGITGGRNMTGSTWDDASIILDSNDILLLFKHLYKTWKESKPVSIENLEQLLEAGGTNFDV